MKKKRFSRLLIATMVVSVLSITAVAFAEEYPSKPINYVIPFGPGGESDITARHQQSFFKELYGENLVISYLPGGGGAVAWSQLNSMKGDGYNIMGMNLPHIILKPMQKDVGFKTDDLVGVYMFHYTPDAIVVTQDSPFNTLQDFIDYAKANPKEITLSGSGKATANHVAQLRFDKMAGIKTTYVSFKGTGEATTALLGKQVKASWGYTSVGAQHSEKLRMLAVAMEERHPIFPDVPTFKQLGFDLVSGAYRGIAVPKSTPEPIREQLSTIIGKINAQPKFKKALERDGMVLLDIDYKAYPAFMKKMEDIYVETATESGILE